MKNYGSFIVRISQTKKKMLVPCIDLVNGETVQLEQGMDIKIKAGDPFKHAKRFCLCPTVSLIDIDGAKGRENTNKGVILDLLKYIHANHPGCNVRVGGGIRKVELAAEYLNGGALEVLIGTRATPEFLKQLPRDRVIVCLDCFNDEHGWESKTGVNLFEKMKNLMPYCDHFFVTFVENEGMMKGVDIERVKKILEVIGKDKKLTVAGGIRNLKEVKQLDELGVDCHVGMAVYKGHIDIGESVWECLKSDRDDKLIPTIIEDVQTHRVIGLAYSSRESVKLAMKNQQGVYFSRSRNQIWEKGKTSGNTQELVRVDVDCDKDCLKFAIKGKGRNFCHNEKSSSCFGREMYTLQSLFDIILERQNSGKETSYTRILLSNNEYLKNKIIEEANELVEADQKEHVISEMCDVLYFTTVYCTKFNIEMKSILGELSRRSFRFDQRMPLTKKNGTNGRINFAIPKGRIKENIIKLFSRMGITFHFKNDRDYRPTVTVSETSKLKPFVEKVNFFITDGRNIITQLQSHTISFGFSGYDLFCERCHIKQKIFEILDLKYNKVDVCVAARSGTDIEHWREKGRSQTVIVYTEYPKLTQEYIRKKKLSNFQIHFSFGSTEGLVPYVADVIVNVKESGKTLTMNGLGELDTIMKSSTRFFASKKESEFTEVEKLFLESLKESL